MLLNIFFLSPHLPKGGEKIEHLLFKHKYGKGTFLEIHHLKTLIRAIAFDYLRNFDYICAFNRHSYRKRPEMKDETRLVKAFLMK